MVLTVLKVISPFPVFNVHEVHYLTEFQIQPRLRYLLQVIFQFMGSPALHAQHLGILASS